VNGRVNVDNGRATPPASTSDMNILRRLAAGVLVGVLVSLGVAGARSAAAPALDPAIAAKVDAVFADVDRPTSPGCALGIVRGGALTYARGYGQASVELGVPIGPSTVFDIGSVSKQFTAMAVMLLVEDGKVSLEDDIRTHFPEIPSYGRPVTVRHLLQHTSGLRDYTGLLELAGYDLRDVTTVPQALGAIARQRGVDFQPGERFQYNNSGFFLASMLVERVSGQTLAAFAQARIFAPLGMTATRFAGSHSISVPGRATAYTPEGDRFAIQMSNWEQTGDGAVQTSVEDLVRWLAAFDTHAVGTAATLEAMETPGRLASGAPIDYGLGQFVGTHRGLRRVYHGGSWAGFRAALYRWPSASTSVMVLCNRSDANPPARAERVSEIVLADRMTPAPLAAPATAAAPAVKDEPGGLDTLAGVYWSAQQGQVARVETREGRLWAPFSRGALPMVPTGPREFVIREPLPFEMRFVFTRGGGHWTLERSVESRERTRFEWRPSWAPSTEELRALAGTYYSAELDAEYVLRMDGTRLVRAPKREAPEPLVPAFAGTFEWGQAAIRFSPDHRSFEVFAGGESGIAFVRR
jgi:CubicO group peptidase (beta-lactamase class C family)